jgi:hypothetical protein
MGKKAQRAEALLEAAHRRIEGLVKEREQLKHDVRCLRLRLDTTLYAMVMMQGIIRDRETALREGEFLGLAD